MLTEFVRTRTGPEANFFHEAMLHEKAWLSMDTCWFGDAVKGSRFKKYQKYLSTQTNFSFCHETFSRGQHVETIEGHADQQLGQDWVVAEQAAEITASQELPMARRSWLSTSLILLQESSTLTLWTSTQGGRFTHLARTPKCPPFATPRKSNGWMSPFSSQASSTALLKRRSRRFSRTSVRRTSCRVSSPTSKRRLLLPHRRALRWPRKSQIRRSRIWWSNSKWVRLPSTTCKARSPLCLSRLTGCVP